MPIYCLVFILIMSYLIGSFPTAYLMGKLKGVDLRRFGSGNVGSTNAFRVLGPFPGLSCLFIDILKGYLAVTLLLTLSFGLFRLPGGSEGRWIRILAGISVIAGHNWTIFLKFKGGKGVATSAGVFLGLVPEAVGLAALVWLVVFFIARYVSLGSLLASLGLPFFIWMQRGDLIYILFGALITIAVFIRHRANIKRLIKGKENKISWGKKK